MWIDYVTKIKALKLINTEHLKSCESFSIKASEETFIGPTTKLLILLYDCTGTSSRKQTDIFLSTYLYQLISFTKEISSSNHIILSMTTTEQMRTHCDYVILSIISEEQRQPIRILLLY